MLFWTLCFQKIFCPTADFWRIYWLLKIHVFSDWLWKPTSVSLLCHDVCVSKVPLSYSAFYAKCHYYLLHYTCKVPCAHSCLPRIPWTPVGPAVYPSLCWNRRQCVRIFLWLRQGNVKLRFSLEVVFKSWFSLIGLNALRNSCVHYCGPHQVIIWVTTTHT